MTKLAYSAWGKGYAPVTVLETAQVGLVQGVKIRWVRGVYCRPKWVPAYEVFDVPPNKRARSLQYERIIAGVGELFQSVGVLARALGRRPQPVWNQCKALEREGRVEMKKAGVWMVRKPRVDNACRKAGASGSAAESNNCSTRRQRTGRELIHET